MDSAGVNPQGLSKNSKISEIALLSSLIFLVIVVRLYVDFKSGLMYGVNTPYYPVQIRSILESGKIGFPDLPLVFYLEALVAKLLILFNLCDFSDCIMTSWKIIDSALYPIIVVPIFWLTKTIAKEIKVSKWTLFLPSILAVISFPSWIMMGELQKNQVGLLWSAFVIYFLYKGISEGKAASLILAGIFFVLTGLTHLGAFGFILVFSASILFFSIIFNREQRFNFLKLLIILLSAITLIALYLVFFDPQRFGRLFSVISLPIKIFEQPMILQLFKNPSSTALFYLMNPMGINANLVAILGLILLARKRQLMALNDKILLLSATLVTLFMGSPFLGSEWAQRLYLMAYMPTIIVFAFLLKYTTSWWKKALLTTLVLIVTSLPTPMLLISGVKSTSSIDEKAYSHLLELKKVIINPDETLIIARHGLEWWSAWVLEVDVSSKQDLDRKIFESYESVLLLRQRAGKGTVGPPGSADQFPEVEIPPNAFIIHEDEYFILAEVK